MDNLLNAIQAVGYPINANVRITPVTFFDEQTLSATIGDNRYFTSDSLSTYTRNKKFPLSGNEIAFIDTISARLMGTTALSLTAANMGLFTKTALQILVDGRERLKIPLVECLSAPMGTAFGANTIVTLAVPVGRNKRLRLPIMVNSQSNVEVKVITDADYNALGVLRVELSGVMYNKLTAFDFNPAYNKPVERLSYTMYDTVAVVAAGQTVNLFTSPDKTPSLFSKVFPLSGSETFDIENIEIAFPCCVGAAGSYQSVYGLAKETNLKINVNNVDFVDLASKDLTTVLYQNSTVNPFKMSDNSITVDTKQNIIEYAGYTLPVAVTVPSKSQVRVTLDQNAITSISASEYINVMLKGTLQRVVQ